MMPDKETFIAMKIAAYREKIDDFSEGINHILCKSCGGKCCKFSPCTLMPCDVSDMSPKGIENMLDTGNYSLRVIKRSENFDDDEFMVTLCSRQRNDGRARTSLLFDTCALWSEKGCMFSAEQRPTGARLLIPHRSYRCPNLLTNKDVREAWNDCQDVMIQALLNETGNMPKQEYFKVCKNTLDIIFEKPEEQHTPYELNLINHCIFSMYWSKTGISKFYEIKGETKL